MQPTQKAVRLISNVGRNRENRSMNVIRESSLQEYATQFWKREEKKNPSHPALPSIRQRNNPIEILKEHHDYKLPRPENNVVRIVSLNREEVDRLLIHGYMVNDEWMIGRGIKIETRCRNLKDLAIAFLEQRYFWGSWNDTQIECYKVWKSRCSLENAITDSKRTLIERVGQDVYEIVDGWGRLLPFVALLQEGYDFSPIETFVASSG